MLAVTLTALTVVVAGAALRPPPPRRGLADAVPPARPRVPRPERARRPRRRTVPPAPLELAAWCDALAREVRSGATLRHAITAVAPPPCADALMEPVRHALDRGAPLRAALAPSVTGGDPPPHLDLVLVVLRACAQHGGAAGEPIDRCAAALRQRSALLAERASSSAQARLSAVVMTLLPVTLLAVLLLTSSPVRAAVVSPIGLVVVALGGACNVAGWSWMRRLIRGGAPW